MGKPNHIQRLSPKYQDSVLLQFDREEKYGVLQKRVFSVENKQMEQYEKIRYEGEFESH